MRSPNSIIRFKFPLAVNCEHYYFDETQFSLWDEDFFGAPEPNLATMQAWNAELVAAEPKKKRRTPQSVYVELSGIALTNQELMRGLKICLAVAIMDHPELAGQIQSELGIVIDPNEPASED